MINHGIVINFLAQAAEGSTGHSAEHMVAVFIAQIALMLLVGRLLGEAMHRIGQPAVMGQLIAGILLGPSVLGALWPAAQHAIFPNLPEQKKMIDAISQLGVLMLLLLTGIETDLALVQRIRRPAFFSSVSGIVFPFLCGFILVEFLPADMLPDPSQRLVTSLFLATALSISSIKIVAMVLLEVDFLRRNIGQIIVASAIVDDTIGWIIISIIAGLAARGTIHLGDLSFRIVGTITFLALSFTIGRRIVAHVIRWTNDNLSIEMPVITAILVLMCVTALITDLIGVHTVLGAFVIGVLIGQSPILTRHIEEQLRGLVVALFAPIFFAVAGLSIDLTILKSAYLIKIAIELILVASFGKLVGCYIGGKLGGLSGREATALAIGMNARGSTEVIIATIGLSMGALTRDMFTLIVVMAVVTTMVTPPLLRWALARIPPTGEEKERLEREAAAAKSFVPKVERLLIAVDHSRHGRLTSVLAGLFAGTRQVLATVLDLSQGDKTQPADASENPENIVKTSIEFAARTIQKGHETAQLPVTPTMLAHPTPAEDTSAAILNEAKKGYDMLFLGIEQVLDGRGGQPGPFGSSVEKIVREFPGATAIVVAKGSPLTAPLKHPMNILVPTTGVEHSRRAGEVAIAIAKACRSTITALYVSPPADETVLSRHPQELLNAGYAVVGDLQALGEREGVHVTPLVIARRAPEAAILRQIERGHYDLVVLGVKARAGERLFFGHAVAALLERAHRPLVIINS